MPKKRFGAEQIVTLLRLIEVLMAQGKSAPEACQEAGVSQQSYYRWRKEYGGRPPGPQTFAPLAPT
jgi:putative transposase